MLFQTLEGQTLPALCYNLPAEPGPEEHNAEYAERLRVVLTKLGFPPRRRDALLADDRGELVGRLDSSSAVDDVFDNP